MNNVKLIDIAKATGFSLATISRALKNDPEIAKITTQKIQEMAKKLGYHPNPSAVRLRTGKSNILLVANNIEYMEDVIFGNPQLQNLEAGCIEQTTNSKYSLRFLPFTSKNFNISIKKVISEQLTDGLIVDTLSLPKQSLNILIENKIPFISLGRNCRNPQYPYIGVGVSNYAYQAANLCINQGCEVIISCVPAHKPIRLAKRRKGLSQALQKALKQPIIKEQFETSIYSFNQYVTFAKETIEEFKNKKIAFCVSSSTAAIAVLKASQICNKTINEDIKIATMTTIPQYFQQIAPQIDAWHVDYHELGKVSIKMLTAKLSGIDNSQLQKVIEPIKINNNFNLNPLINT